MQSQILVPTSTNTAGSSTITNARSKDNIALNKSKSNDNTDNLGTNVIRDKRKSCISNENNNSKNSNHISTSRKTNTKNKMSAPPSKKSRRSEDEISIPTQSDIDDKIHDLCQTGSESESSDEDWDIAGMQADYLDNTDKGPEVDKDLAELFNKIKKSGLSKEKVAAKAKDHPMPANCSLEVKQVNPEIWSNIISTRERSTDLMIQKSMKLVSMATYSILKVADSAINANKNKMKRKDALKSIIKNATDAIALSTTANIHSETLRRQLIVKKLATDQKCIAKDVPVDDKYLFGDNLNKRLQEAAGASKLKPYKFREYSSKNLFRSRKYPRDRKQGYQKGGKGKKSH